MGEERQARYEQEIETAFDWAALEAEARANPQDVEDTMPYGCAYLGTVFELAPSGKIYMPWSSNVTEEEAETDADYYTALDIVAERHGAWVESGEGDPCDIFLCWKI